jgi:hypothetical protein
VSGRAPGTRTAKGARTDAVAPSSGTATAWDRPGGGPLVILVGGAVQHRAVEAAQPAVHATASRHDGRGGGGSAHPAPSAAKRQPEGSGR